jgi:hypothetical protein
MGTAAVGQAALSLHIVPAKVASKCYIFSLRVASSNAQDHAGVIRARNHPAAVVADSHTPNAEAIAQPHGHVLLSPRAHIAQMNVGVDGGVPAQTVTNFHRGKAATRTRNSCRRA